MRPSVWPLRLGLESMAVKYGSAMTFVVTLPTGPVQLLKARLVAVPILTGALPLVVPLGMLPQADDAGVLPLLVHATLTPLLVSTVFVAAAARAPPPRTFPLRVVRA